MKKMGNPKKNKHSTTIWFWSEAEARRAQELAFNNNWEALGKLMQKVFMREENNGFK